MYSGAVAYGAKNQSRCLTALKGDRTRHRFLVGSVGLPRNEQQQHPNDLVLLEYSEDTNDIRETRAYRHPGEVWGISPSPRDPSLCFTSSTEKGGDPTCTLWRLPLPSEGATAVSPPHHQRPQGGFGVSSPFGHGGGGGGHNNNNNHYSHHATPMEAVLTLPTSQDKNNNNKSRVRSVLWSLGEEEAAATTAAHEQQVVSVDGTKATLWDLNHAAAAEAKEVSSFALGGDKGGEVETAAWDPHDPSKIATVQGTGVTHWDLRTGKAAGQADMAHWHGAKDMDFNHSKPYYFVTCGEDRLIKFWDSRKLAGPVKQLAGHTHWVWTVRYNPCHDQLLLSGGTDSVVNLWRVSSISSAPLLELEDVHDSPDVRVKAFEEHEESVYGVAWSACDPFLFASVSYDGRVTVNAVPPSEKYKILL